MMSKVLIRRVRQAELGIVDLIPLVITLPIVLVLFAAVVDMARIPVAHDHLILSLESGAYRVFSILAEDSTARVIDGLPPAGSAVCDGIYSANTCSSWEPDGLTNRQGFLTSTVNTEIVRAACIEARDVVAGSGSGMLAIDPSKDYAFQFVMIRVPVNIADGSISSVELLATSADDCAGTGRSFATLHSLAVTHGAQFDAARIQERLLDWFSSFPEAARWRVDNDDGLNGSYNETPKPYLASYWLVGVGVMKLNHIVGNLLGSESVILEYVVRPLNNPMGFQAA